jgi:hypothetical protein
MSKKLTVKEVQARQAKMRASRISQKDAYDFLEEQDSLSRSEELLKFKREFRIIDEEVNVDFEDMQTLFDKVA